MNYRIIILLFFFQSFLIFIDAQTKNFGFWTSIGIEKELGKWDLSGNVELRLSDGFSEISRSSFQVDAAYNIIKQIKLGAGYEFILFHDLEYFDYQPRQRYFAYFQGKQKFGNFTFYLRERFQRTIKDERDRLLETGYYDAYKINPEWAWRSRLKVAYNIPKIPLTPSFSFESFYQLNNPDGNQFDKLRYTLSLGYNLTKHHKLEIYELIDQKVNVKTSDNRFITGLSYAFSF
jgi:hypothetical protein